MKRNTFWVLLMLMNLFTFSTAYAQTYVNVNGINYSLSGEYASVERIWHKNTDVNIIIPSTIYYEGLPYTVNSIADAAFCEHDDDYTEFESIELPNTIETIGRGAFFNQRLKSIILNEGLKEIGENAFRNTRITEIIIPSTVRSMGAGVFYSCNLLRTIFYLGTTPPKNWVATSQTYVTSKKSYGYPYATINNASVQEMLTMSENTFTYSGKTHNMTWTNNVQGYNVSYNIPTVQKIVGTYNEVLIANFSNGSNSFSGQKRMEK